MGLPEHVYVYHLELNGTKLKLKKYSEVVCIVFIVLLFT